MKRVETITKQLHQILHFDLVPIVRTEMGQKMPGGTLIGVIILYIFKVDFGNPS